MAKPTAPSGALAATRIAGYDASLSDFGLPARIDALTSLPSLANIPSCLKSQRIWYPSRFTLRPNGSLGKPPCDQQGNPAANWQDKSNWSSFDEAAGLDMDGIGIVLHKALGLLGVDFDHCVVDGVIIDPWVAQKVKELNSYTEVSVSGTGIHVLVWGILPPGKCKGGKIEMYDGSGSRFFVVTGNLVPGAPAEIRSAQDTIDAIHLEVFGSGEQISGKTTLQQNQQLNPNPNTSYSQRREEERGEEEKRGEQRFEIRPNVELSVEEWERLNDLRDKLPRFRLTWAEARKTSPWPFKSGRYTSSEYEASIAFFLTWDGWYEQSIMDAICVWRRERGLKAPVSYFRYACTLGKASSMVTPRSKGLGYTRKESKGLYRHGYTRDQILGSIIETPRTPKQIAEYTGITQATVYVVLGRLRKDGAVIRDNHTYLCAPTAVPWYLQNIPENAGEDSGEELMTPEDARVDLDALDAEYAAAVAAGMFEDEPVEEEIEAPEMVMHAPAVIKHTLPDFDEYVEPELVTQPIPAPVSYAPFETWKTYAARTEAWEIKWKKDNLERRREARKHPNYQSMVSMKREAKEKKELCRGYAGFLPHPSDLYLARINEMTPQELAARDNIDDSF